MRRRLVIALGAGLVAGAATCAAAGDLGYPGSALKEFERTSPRPSFEDALPLDLQPNAGAAAQEPEKPPTRDDRAARCFVKIEGRVLINGPCKTLREKDKSVTFDLAGKPLVISFREGRIWAATWEGRDLGKVYKRGDCWGSRGFYACDHGR